MNKGQSLFEIVMALAIISIIIVGVVILAAGSIRNSNFSRDKTLATRYSQELTEWLRGERDKSWATFMTNINSCSVKYDTLGLPYVNHCYPSGGLSWSKCDCASGDVVGNNFTRQALFYCRIVSQANVNPKPVSCSTVGINDVLTNSNVSWTDALGLHETDSVTDYSNWRAQ